MKHLIYPIICLVVLVNINNAIVDTFKNELKNYKKPDLLFFSVNRVR